MSILERLEDCRRDWQNACVAPIEQHARHLMERLSDILPDPAGPLTDEQSAQLAAALEGTRDWAEKRLLPLCLSWLRETKLWPDPAARDGFVHVELTAALQHLPPFEPCPPEPASHPPTRCSSFVAACGAALGMFLLTPLTLLLLGQREIGLFAGGILGSAGLVALIRRLAASPRMRPALTAALVASAAGSLLGGVWSYWRQRSTGWLRAALGLLVTVLVVLLARPRIEWPSRQAYLLHICHQLGPHLRHVADLVLAWCWAHPARLPARPEAPGGEAAPMSSLVCAALADLHSQLTSGDRTPADLRDSVEELLQRLEDDGCVWKTILNGTPFDEAMREDFDTFGCIDPGQPVRTRRAALRHRGQLVQKGELRRA
ncbi:MAG TPA: hypothetical protein VH575_27180 [Gemmataceae bacterium]|jgi:hypothetical protein